MKHLTAIVDYGVGNLRSIANAMDYLGMDTAVTADAGALERADAIILPGVGAFPDAAEKLRAAGLDRVLLAQAEKKPVLGICLGMQLLFERSDESDGVPGIGVLEGDIIKIPDTPGLKIPHMGWNSLEIRPGTRLYEGIENGSYVYFVHSYYLKARDEAIVAASTEYGCHIHASVESGNVFGCQFHPEKSSTVGLSILKNFLSVPREV